MSTYFFRSAKTGDRKTILFRSLPGALTIEALVLGKSGQPEVVTLPSPQDWTEYNTSDLVHVVRDDELHLLWVGTFVEPARAYRLHPQTIEAVIHALAEFVNDGKLTIEVPSCSD